MSERTRQPGAFPPPQAIEPGPHRVHVAYVPLTAVRSIRQWLPAFLGLAVLGVQDGGPAIGSTLVTAGVVLLLAGVIVHAVVSYRRFSWELLSDGLRIQRGAIVRRETDIPYGRIHAVDHSAKIVDRILGVVTLQVETAGGGPRAEAEIPALVLPQAQALRAELYARQQRLVSATGGAPGEAATAEGPWQAGAAPTADGTWPAGAAVPAATRSIGAPSAAAPPPSPDFEYRLGTRELLMTGVANSNTLLLVLAAYGALSQVLQVFGTDDTAILGMAGDALVSLVSQSILVTLMFLLAALLVAWMISIVSTVLSYGGFVVRRRAERIEVERGLLAHHVSSVALDRIQSVTIKQGVIRRILGYAEVAITSVSAHSEADATRPDLVVHPMARLADADAFIAAIAPGFAEAPRALAPVPRRALRRSIIRWTLWPGLVSGIAFVLIDVFAAGSSGLLLWVTAVLWVAILGIGAVTGYLSWKARGYAHSDAMLVVRTGVLGRTTHLVPRAKVQRATASASWFQRRARLASIAAWTASGTGGSRTHLRDLDVEDAAGYLAWIEPRTVPAGLTGKPNAESSA